MRLYFDIISFQFKRFLAYPLEMVFLVLRRVMEVGFLVLFWAIFAKASSHAVSLTYLISYFVISGSLNELMMGERLQFGMSINLLFKYGEFNNYLLKPVGIIGHLYARDVGRYGVPLLTAVITLLIGIAIDPPPSLLSLVWFGLAFVVGALIFFAINLIAGTLAFYITETQTMRQSTHFLIRVFAGTMIPLSFFPDKLKEFVAYTPFPALVYVPITALKSVHPDPFTLRLLLAGCVWAPILLLFALWFWRVSIKNYDAVGI